MARLVAAFGSSHSLMLAAELEDWLTRFRQNDQRLPYYDRDGGRSSFAEVLARAPANAESLITAEAITGRFHQVQEAMARAAMTLTFLEAFIGPNLGRR